MNSTNPEDVFKWIQEHSSHLQFTILVCGGDGSIGWLLSIASKMKFIVRKNLLSKLLQIFKI